MIEKSKRRRFSSSLWTAEPSLEVWRWRRRWRWRCVLASSLVILGLIKSDFFRTDRSEFDVRDGNLRFRRNLSVPPPKPNSFGRVRKEGSAPSPVRAEQAPSENSWVDATFGELMDEVVAQINRVRSSERQCGGEPFAATGELRVSSILEEVANAHAAWMVEADEYAHVTPQNPLGSTPVERVSAMAYGGMLLGENLAWGQESPREVVTWWLRSSQHCRLVMNAEADEVGVGLEAAVGAERGFVWVMLVGGSGGR